MAPLSLKIVLDDGAVTRTVLFDTNHTVKEAHDIILQKFYDLDHDKEYGLFMTSADDERSGVWLEGHRTLEFYMLRDGDSLQCLCKTRNMRFRMLDGTLKTLQVDESKIVGDLLFYICNKIGITNHDEYGLCHEESEEVEEVKPATGTLTLKRPKPAEKDARLEQLSKKLKTDDNVEWLDQKKTLRELQVDPKETLLLKRRLFYSDRKIDVRDPVQLNLLYVQTRDNVLSGRQVTTEEKAIEFAGIQCQIQYGDFDEEKHKPGFIENLSEFLPTQYTSSWGVERRVYREHSKHTGLAPLAAKCLYTRIARELPTYGVTFFLVKEKEKNKKKLVPRLLGINSSSILRLHETTKEILKVWLLTQVKSYNAGKTTFTLNFGDYSDKEYTVKTNEAYRIRDILEGYIDIIRKKAGGPHNPQLVEGHMVCEDHVEISRGNIIQNVMAQKLMEHSFVGPSQIVSYEMGQEARKGTQIVTVQQMIVTNESKNKQQAMNSEVPASHIPEDFNRKLNRFNSYSVKAVMLLSDPSPTNLEQVKKIAGDLEAELPDIVKGVEALAQQQATEEDRKRLLDELEELRKYLLTFASCARRSDLSPEDLELAEEAAKKMAELSSQLTLAVDPRSRKRSDLLRRSRKSFIADERVEATLRRASFLTLLSTASKAVEDSIDDLQQPYEGPAVSEEEARQLRVSAADNIAKLNAAVASLLAARADPKNVDYETAMNSMNTIKELTPLLTQDAKALSSTKDGEVRKDLLDKIRALCESLNTLCTCTGVDKDPVLRDAAEKYANTAGKLIYVFNPKARGSGLDSNKETEITNLAKEVGGRTSLLLKAMDQLIEAAYNDPRTQALDNARLKCGDSAKGLQVCTQLVASTINEPHCQSALTAALEELSSSVQLASVAWRPLIEDQHHHHGRQLDDTHTHLLRAIERLKKAYDDLNGDNDESPDEEADKAKEMKRLQFITGLSAAKHSMKELERELLEKGMEVKGKPIKDVEGNKAKLQSLLSQKIAQLNAAMASLIHSTSDNENPDYETAEAAINLINELTPEVIKDTKSLCPYEDEKTRRHMMEEITALCQATQCVCASAENGNFKDVHEAACDFANSSGKLCYIFNPRANPDKENQIVDISRSACQKASEMLSKVYQLAEAVGGDSGTQLDQSGTKVVEAAKALFVTAQITAPSIKDSRCQSSLIASADTVSELSQHLASLWEPIVRKPEYQALGNKLNKDREIMEATLEKLRNACKPDDDVEVIKEDPKASEKQRLKFIMTMTDARKKLGDAERLLVDHNKDMLPVCDKNFKNCPEHKDLQRVSGQKLGELNAAIAALVRATSDTENPDYKTAECSIATISKLTPEIIQNTNKLSQYMEEKQRRAMLDNVRGVYKACSLICDSMENNDFKELSNAANKLGNCSGHLYYVFNPRANVLKENQIMDTSKAACEKASEMLSLVYELAERVGGEDGSRLDSSGASLVDAAQALLTTAQVTAPLVSDSRCQAELLSSIDAVSDLNKKLVSEWQPLVQDPNHQALGNQINREQEALEAVLEALRNVCKTDSEVSRKPQKPEPPVRTNSLAGDENIKATKRVQFCKSVDEAQNKIKRAEEDLASTEKYTSPLIISEQEKLQDLMQNNLALAGIAVSRLISDMNPQHMNYESAIKSTELLAELVPEIVKTGKEIGSAKEETERKTFLADMLSFCEASNILCDTAKNNPKDINMVAVDFSNKASKVLYDVSAEIDPSQERKVIDRAREIGDSASRLTARGVAGAAEGGAGAAEGGEGGAGGVAAVGAGGTNCADAATELVYTAKLLASTIHNKESRKALLNVSNKLSSKVNDFALTWQPLAHNPDKVTFVQELDSEATHLKHLLERFDQDLKNDTIVRRRVVEKLIVQDTPLRQFATRILETAQAKAVYTGITPDERKGFADYSSKLSAAIKDLDLANARSRSMPHDEGRRQQLEEAVQRLQQTCLESRIQAGGEKRFVDLMDLINDVSADAKSISEAASAVKPEYNKSALNAIKEETDDIIKEAVEASQPSEGSGDRGDLDDILIIKKFAQKCDERVNVTRRAIEEIPDDSSKTMLLDKITSLKGSSDLLMFAVNSHIAAVRSAALDVNQNDFTELENNIDNILQSKRRTKVADQTGSGAFAAAALCSAVASQNAPYKIPQELAAYLLEVRANTDCTDPDHKYRLQEHLKNLLQLLKTQNLVRSRRIATWQCGDDEDIDDITRTIIKEIETFNKEDSDGVQRRSDVAVINENDLANVLFSPRNVVHSNEKQVQHKMEQQVEKLSSLVGMVALNVDKKEALARTLHAAAQEAIQLAAAAKAISTHDPIKKMRVEELSEAMCSQTYNLLKTAETTSKDPHNPESHRRLHEACRLLNDSINKLSRAVRDAGDAGCKGGARGAGEGLARACSEARRRLQLRRSTLRALRPATISSYALCLETIHNPDNLQFLQNEEAMTRDEFVSNLHFINSMACRSAENAEQCAYLLSLPADQQHVAKEGFVNVPRLRNIISDIKMASLKIIRCANVEQASYFQSEINQNVVELQEVAQDAMDIIKDPKLKSELTAALQQLDDASKSLREDLRSPGDVQGATSAAIKLLDAAEDFNVLTSVLSPTPIFEPTAECKARSDDVINSAKSLINKTLDLVTQVGASDQEVLSWGMFETGRSGVLKAYEDFVISVRENGRRAGFIQEEAGVAEEEAPKKTFVQLQLDLANKWLTTPAAKPDVKSTGMQAVTNIVDLVEKVSEDMKGEEKLDMVGMLNETRELLDDCSTKYNSEKASLLLERLRELQKMLNWQVVSRVVEDFLEEEPLADLEVLADVEKDDQKRKYILEKKIAELLSQLGKVTTTVRLVAHTGPGAPSDELMRTKDQAELLAPALVKAAQDRVKYPDNTEAVEKYKALLAQYADSMSKLRELCDRSIDPVDFAQAAGETMQRMREEFSAKSDPQTCATTTKALNRLGLRVVAAGMCSREVQRDPEVKKALVQAQRRLVTSAGQRASRVHDWGDVAAEILRTTGQVESFLGGESIFQKQPEPDQPIYAAALGLHAAVREWSARDNDIVAAAKRMAVLMARLSDCVADDRKSELLSTSKNIVASSHQVAALARKLALECTDMRIRTNLMQVCERIPTISGQLKMLITVKGSSLGHQGSEEDKEAMNTLIGNAQNLMLSIQEVVKAAIAASVKIMSQRGPRIKWVRRVFY